MTMESLVYGALQSLVSGRVFPDIAEERATLPYITFQQVGGDAVNYIDPTAPNRSNARLQVNVWSKTRIQAALIAGQVEAALRATTALQTTVLGARVSLFEPETQLRGTLQHFSVWTDA